MQRRDREEQLKRPKEMKKIFLMCLKTIYIITNKRSKQLKRPKTIRNFFKNIIGPKKA